MSSVLRWPTKDPDEVLDFTVDWAARLDDDTISTSTWTVPSGIIKVEDEHTTTKAVIWLQGGTIDKVYEFLNRIVTTGGRTMDQSVSVRVRSK